MITKIVNWFKRTFLGYQKDNLYWYCEKYQYRGISPEKCKPCLYARVYE